jgi:hypothetical protein
MREFVGVTYIGRISSSLKREALVFNRIGVFMSGVDRYLRLDPQFLAELEWVQAQNIAFGIDPPVRPEKIQSKTDALTATGWIANVHGERNFLQAELLKLEVGLKINDLADRPDTRELLQKLNDLKQRVEGHRINCFNMFDIFCRVFCRNLQITNGIDAFPLNYNEELPSELQVANKADVIRIVIKALPMPDADTPWEQILEYRSDPNSFEKIFALRHWINQTAKAGLSQREVQDNLEWLVFDYERHLKLHKLKTNLGAFETIVTVGAEFLESLAKVNWAKAARLLFTFKHRKVELLEAEMKSPGSEVAYILETRNQFEKT